MGKASDLLAARSVTLRARQWAP